jgi:hypothetical protein
MFLIIIIYTDIWALMAESSNNTSKIGSSTNYYLVIERVMYVDFPSDSYSQKRTCGGKYMRKDPM